MSLTETEKLLIRGLMLFPLNEQERKAIFHILQSDAERWALMDYLQQNRNATAQEIKEEVSRIIKEADGL